MHSCASPTFLLSSICQCSVSLFLISRIISSCLLTIFVPLSLWKVICSLDMGELNDTVKAAWSSTSATQGQKYIFTGVFIAAIFLITKIWTKQDVDSREPVLIKPKIPFVGHIINMVRLSLWIMILFKAERCRHYIKQSTLEYLGAIYPRPQHSTLLKYIQQSTSQAANLQD